MKDQIKDNIEQFECSNRAVQAGFRLFPEMSSVYFNFNKLQQLIQEQGVVEINDPLVGICFISTLKENGHKITCIASDLTEFVANTKESLEYFIDKYIDENTCSVNNLYK